MCMYMYIRGKEQEGKRGEREGISEQVMVRRVGSGGGRGGEAGE